MASGGGESDPQVKNAIGFLSHAKVKPSPTADKVAFLKKKGLTNQQIAQAFTSLDPNSPDAKDVLAGKFDNTTATTAVQPATPAVAAVPQYIPMPPPPPPPPAQASPNRWIAFTLGGLALLAVGGASGYFINVKGF
jgi:hypothetical protein